METSAPTKTSANNIEKNTAAGVVLTITATLPNDVKPTKVHLEKTLPLELRDRYVVTNVLELLRCLQGGAP